MNSNKAVSFFNIKTNIRSSQKMNFLFISFLLLSFCSTLNLSGKSLLKKETEFVQLSTEAEKTSQEYGSNPLYIVKGKCSTETCENGTCSDANSCVCNSGYGQLSPNTHSNVNSTKMCTYKLKSQFTAFFLETFLVFGFGHLYCGRILNSLLKLLIILSILAADFTVKYFVRIQEYKSKKVVYIISYIFYGIIIIWQITDVVMFGLNYYKDGNNMPLWVYEG